mgnify:CR=1 FL=1
MGHTLQQARAKCSFLYFLRSSSSFSFLLPSTLNNLPSGRDSHAELSSFRGLRLRNFFPWTRGWPVRVIKGNCFNKYLFELRFYLHVNNVGRYDGFPRGRNKTGSEKRCPRINV